jgi:hypothetical protein
VKHRQQVHDVFGVSNTVLKDSYVDRGELDARIARDLKRNIHVALNGVSKSGKSWIRQQLLPNALVVQCRLNKTVVDIYTEALGQLGIRFEVSSKSSSSLKGTVEASGEVGAKLIARVAAKFGFERAVGDELTTEPVSQNVQDLAFVAALLIESGRRLVIEDFHYLSRAEREVLAFDLKTLWDLKVLVVVIGIWSETNYLLSLNRDLVNRMREHSVVWSDADLDKIFLRGGPALNVTFDSAFRTRAVAVSYGNAGILQRIILDSLDELGIEEEQDKLLEVDNVEVLETVGLSYAEDLNGVYQPFAKRVSAGIRTRQNATGIYAHAMAAALEASDRELIRGVHIDTIFAKASGREPRIIKGNLKTALGRIESLQVDSEGRGLVLSYADEHVRVVDRELLLYRQYQTVHWPWEDLINDAETNEFERFEPGEPSD